MLCLLKGQVEVLNRDLLTCDCASDWRYEFGSHQPSDTIQNHLDRMGLPRERLLKYTERNRTGCGSVCFDVSKWVDENVVTNSRNIQAEREASVGTK